MSLPEVFFYQDSRREGQHLMLGQPDENVDPLDSHDLEAGTSLATDANERLSSIVLPVNVQGTLNLTDQQSKVD